jgi:protein SCO1/2
MLLALLLALGAVALVASGCGSDESSSGGTPSTVAATGEQDGEHTDEAPMSGSDILFPPIRAPELGLRDHLGRQVQTADFRGKAMLVTFVYANCPDVCPIIVSNMRRLQGQLGDRAKELQIVAVSVDPKGDTPALVTDYLKRQRMTGRMLWLVGSRDELEAAWTRWGIATRIPRENPDLVEHASPIYGVDRKGTIQTIYDTSFRPADVLRDVSILFAE